MYTQLPPVTRFGERDVAQVKFHVEVRILDPVRAIEAARQLSPAFPNAVWFVSLADVEDPALVADAVADGLRLARSSEVDRIEQIAMLVGRQAFLLILDNLEHLLEAGRELVRQLLHRAPWLVCLVTSRQPLSLEGEREIPVLPLAVPRTPPLRGDGRLAHSHL